jgi:ParB-like chromosome segregation protein Spo0J
LNIETVAIASLAPDPANARKHDDKNLNAIKGSLARFGQQKPLVIDEKNIVLAGNGTLAAAQALGWTEIKVVRSTLAGIDKTAFAIADNRTTDLSHWDLEFLTPTLKALDAENFDLDQIGFSKEDLEKFLGQEFEFEEPADKKETKDGYTLQISFENEDEQQALFFELRDRGFKVKA